ncbi:MAG: TIGR00730 family Rossman fold protein [Balneolaceae bacterium]|nr:MAG: TIGR00730 family Rossman fold protein [Balneolaceae bacterium]
MQNLCVYCGSSAGNDPEITKIAVHLGSMLAESGTGLVYGGSSLGIMGTLANSVMENGGTVTGVIPRGLFKKEVAHQGITRLITVRNMHERKSTMADLADAFLALPGGFGTLEELFEIITWNQIGIISKPVTLFNFKGFYDPLIRMIEQASDGGFIRDENRKILNIAETLDQCIRFSTLHPKT